jgi:hypothetical protein
MQDTAVSIPRDRSSKFGPSHRSTSFESKWSKPDISTAMPLRDAQWHGMKVGKAEIRNQSATRRTGSVYVLHHFTGDPHEDVVVIRNGKLLFADMFSNQKYVALSVDLAEPLSRTFKKP